MIGTAPQVITIQPTREQTQDIRRQRRVAAYCRVSTDDEEQLTSYEAQQAYYTDKIMKNREWTMAGIFADSGLTGTSARKRPEFMRMIRQCKRPLGKAAGDAGGESVLPIQKTVRIRAWKGWES